MSQLPTNHLGRERGGKVASEFSAASVTTRAEELIELLDSVRRHAVLLASQVHSPPRTLRIRAGDVSVDVEWAQEHIVTARGDTEPATALVAEPVTEAHPEKHYLTSPAVGVFYRAPEPGMALFVDEGDMVQPGQQVGIIEAMKLIIPVETDKAGRVVEVLKNDGEPVEYGERLFGLASISGS